MVKKIVSILLAGALGTIGCTSPRCSTNPVGYTEKVISKFNRKLDQNGYECYGVGIDHNCNTIRMIARHYYTRDHHFRNVSEARRAYIVLVTQLLTTLNNDKEIRTSLFDFPFTVANLEFSIRTLDKKNQPPPAPYIFYIQNEGNKIAYFTYSEQPPNYRLIHVETWDEAVAILQQEKFIE
jgi:hypothetical protein